METKEKSCERNSKKSKMYAFCQLHCYGLLQGILVCGLMMSIAWIMLSPLPEGLHERGMLTRSEAFGFAFVIPFILGVSTVQSFNSRWIAFSFTVLWGYLLAILWCWFSGITYLIPLAIAAVITANYNKFRKNDLRMKRHEVLTKVISTTLLTLGLALFFGWMAHKSYLQEQEYIREAKRIHVIELVEVKNNYIFTKEYGLEEATETVKAPAGSKIHRLPVKNDKVFVLPE